MGSVTDTSKKDFLIEGRRRLGRVFQSQAMILLLFLFIVSVAVSLYAPRFANINNIAVITRSAAFVSLVSLGQMTALIAGYIDISIGATAGFCGIIGAMIIHYLNLNPYLAFLIAIMVGALIGTINGLLVSKVNLNPFITTLSTSFVINGMILVVTSGWPVPIVSEIEWLGKGSWGPVPIPTIIAILVAIILGFFLRYTVMGRYIFALGGNKEAAKLVGIPTTKVTITVFSISGSLAALAGVLMMARLASGQPTIGQSWLLPSFAAPILGGAALSGGAGSAFGTLVGAMLMSVISNSIVMTGMSVYWENVIVGLVLISAIILDKVRKQNQ
jgi:ribose transport system permease protein